MSLNYRFRIFKECFKDVSIDAKDFETAKEIISEMWKSGNIDFKNSNILRISAIPVNRNNSEDVDEEFNLNE